MWKQCGFFDQRNYIEKSTWKQSGFFDQQNYAKKGTWKRRGYFDQRNYIEKVRGNDVEIRRNVVFNISTENPRRIDVDSTWCACWVTVSSEISQFSKPGNISTYNIIKHL